MKPARKLQRYVVRITEGESGTVTGIDDAAMGDAKFV